MQKMATEIANVRAESRVLNRVVAAAAVSFIADNRVFEPREMNTNLVCPSVLISTSSSVKRLKRSPHAIERQRTSPAAHDGHARAVRRIAREWLIDLSRTRFSLARGPARRTI